MKDLGYRVYTPTKRNPKTLPTYGNFSKQGPRGIAGIYVGTLQSSLASLMQMHSMGTVRENEQVRYSWSYNMGYDNYEYTS